MLRRDPFTRDNDDNSLKMSYFTQYIVPALSESASRRHGRAKMQIYVVTLFPKAHVIHLYSSVSSPV